MIFKTLFTTFYSYKGGVGRTSALVNTALLRAISGDRVVVLDFDLEAPGVSSYVKELASRNEKDIDLDTCAGVLDYLYEATETNQIPSIKENAVSGTDLGLDTDGEIWFIGAGKTTDKDYSKKLGSLNWGEIFEKKQGALIIENLKQQIAKEFDNPDYVFIDSRTGITEIGGVCTRYLADLVVVLSSLNEQNILGTSRIYNAFKESNISTILVASNVPVGLPWGHEQLFSSRIENFSTKFGSPPDLLIYHYPSLSLKEFFPAYFKLEKEGSVLKEDPLLKSYEILSNKIESKNKNSFDKFLSGIFHKIIFPNEKRKIELEDAFSFFKKYYTNHENVVKAIKNIYELKKILDNDLKSNKEKIDKDFFENIKSLKNANLKPYRYHNLFILKEMVLDNASERIVSFYANNNDKVKELRKWYEYLGDPFKFDAIILLIGNLDFEYVYKIISEEQHYSYFMLAKAYAAEMLNKGDAKKYYELFLKNVHESRMESAGVLFACAYAAFKLDKLDLSKTYLSKSHEAIKQEYDNISLFVPTKFIKVKSKNEFIAELSNFENSYFSNKDKVK